MPSRSGRYFNPEFVTIRPGGPFDGDPEIQKGKETGMVWSDEWDDWIRPDLDKIHEDFAPQAAKAIEICYTCPYWKPSTRQCKECGCFMDLKKVAWRLFAPDATTCPLGKW